MPAEGTTPTGEPDPAKEPDTADETNPTGEPTTTDETNATAEPGCDEETPRCYCPLGGVVDRLARKYAMQVVCVVGAHGTVRFSDIEAHLPGASTSTLSARLSELVEAGLVERTQHDEIPPRVEYELTADGRELQARLEPLLEWAVERQRPDRGRQ